MIPIWFSTVKEGFFSDQRKFGGLFFDPNTEAEPQLQEIAETLAKRLVEDREEDAKEGLVIEDT